MSIAESTVRGALKDMGVTDEKIKKLRMIGVDYAQGYAFSKPMSLDDLQGFLMQKTA